MRQILKLIYKISLFLLSWQGKPSYRQANSIILVKIEGIGDYLLFRNFLSSIKQSQKFSNYHLTLVGNEAWREIAENFDANLVDKFIWLNHKQFGRNLYYRFKKLKQITAIRYDYAIYTTYLRETLFGDSIMRSINANQKVASYGNLQSRSKLENYLTNLCYTQLLPAKAKTMFEFYRNQEFFDCLLDKIIPIKLELKAIETNYRLQLPQTYIVLFVGASEEHRKWSLINYITLAKKLTNTYDYPVILCGVKADLIKFNWLNLEPLGNKIINLIAKTNLTELIDIISRAKFVISNETSIPHMSVAMNVPVLVLYNGGNHYGRFIPYPQGLSHCYWVIYPPQLEKESYQTLANKYSYKSSWLNINTITVDAVIKKIVAVLS